MAEGQISDWLDQARTWTIHVNPEDIRDEAISNMWTFSISLEEADNVSSEVVEQSFRHVISSLREQAKTRSLDPMIFYCWHDEQAGQLRFSLVSASHGVLPFGCDLAPVDSWEGIVASWLRSPLLDGIQWHELQSADTDEELEQVPIRLAVWSTSLR